MFRLELLFLMQCLLGILMMFFLHKINQIKKQVDEITKEVKDYLSFVEQDVEDEIRQQAPSEKKVKQEVLSKDEAENRLIQAVLKEYFP